MSGQRKVAHEGKTPADLEKGLAGRGLEEPMGDTRPGLLAGAPAYSPEMFPAMCTPMVTPKPKPKLTAR